MSTKRPLVILLAATAFLSFIIASRVPMTVAMRVFLNDAIEWAASGRIASTFLPLGYPMFIAPAFSLAGFKGIIALQIILQLCFAVVSYQILCVLGLTPRWSAWGALPVALFPELLLSISKVWDVSFSAFLLILFVLCCLRIAHRTALLALQIALALVFAAAIFCRPNLVLMLPVIVVLLLRRRKDLSPVRAAGRIAIFLVVTASAFVLLGIVSHGSAFFPGNGPYNLYAGHNVYTMQALLYNLNAEPSIADGFYAAYPGAPTPDLSSPLPGSDSFIRQSIHFAIHHPGLEFRLFFVKLFTLFRPDTKVHGIASFNGLGKCLVALPALLFFAALVSPGRPAFNSDDRLLLAVELMYIAPFLITNSDPRFRTPLDVLLLLHLASLIYRRCPRSSADAVWMP